MFGYGGMGRYYATRTTADRCFTCKGTGTDPYVREQYEINMPCDMCNGTGLSVSTEVQWYVVVIMFVLLAAIAAASFLIAAAFGAFR